MSDASCPREAEVLRAVARGWRSDTDVAVAGHAAVCVRCAGVQAAAELLRAEHLRIAQAARVPPSAAMWWRVERRLREEHARRVQRIAFAVQAVVLAAATGGVAAVLQIAAPWLAGSGAIATGAWHAVLTVLTTWGQATSAWTLPIAIVAAAWALLLPAALYFGFADE
jgi:hypothetical protein